MKSSAEIVAKARKLGVALPAFNIAHLPMVAPVVRAVRDQRSFARVEVSRIDCLKFGARSMAAVAEEFRRHADPKHVRLHLDHVPVIDEDGNRAPWAGPRPPYEELFAAGRGFTRGEEATQFVRETGVDWLSVAIGSVHGAVSDALKNAKKVEARLRLAHLSRR